MNRLNIFQKSMAAAVAVIFTISSLGVSPNAYAQSTINLPPQPILSLTQPFNPLILKGVKVNPDNPFQFDFILDQGNSGLASDALEHESTKLIKYFLASLAIPESDLWVNLSPYEKERIIPETFGQTEMGRDLLAQDYLLKQLTASLLHPDGEYGKKFWDRVYKDVYDKFGTTDIPVDTFNKIWIMPKAARIYEDDGVAYVLESRLKVMLERDYVALKKSKEMIGSSEHVEQIEERIEGATSSTATTTVSAEILRDVLIPAIEQEANHGAHFAQLRQIYSAFILATWYKQKMKHAVLNQIYVDNEKVQGVDHDDEGASERIWQQYSDVFKSGAYDMIKEEYDPVTQDVVNKKYFSGGMKWDSAMVSFTKNPADLQAALDPSAVMLNVTVDMAMNSNDDNSRPISQEKYDQDYYVVQNTPATHLALEIPEEPWNSFPDYTSEIKRVLKEELSKDKYKVLFAGYNPKSSIARNVAMPFSDIDHLIIIHNNPDVKEVEQLKSEFISQLRKNFIGVSDAKHEQPIWVHIEEIKKALGDPEQNVKLFGVWPILRLVYSAIQNYEQIIDTGLDQIPESETQYEVIGHPPSREKQSGRERLFEVWSSLSPELKKIVWQVHMPGESFRIKRKQIKELVEQNLIFIRLKSPRRSERPYRFNMIARWNSIIIEATRDTSGENPSTPAMIGEEPAPAQADDTSNAAMSTPMVHAGSELDRLLHRVQEENYSPTYEEYLKAMEKLQDPKVQEKWYDRVDKDGRWALGSISLVLKFPSLRKAIAKEILSLAKKGDRILFIAEGHGHLALQVMDDGNDLDLKIEAVDINAKNTVFATQKGLKQQVADAHDMSDIYDPNTFDLVIINEAIGSFRLKDVLKEVRRVLKPNGRAVISVHPPRDVADTIQSSSRTQFTYFRPADVVSGFGEVGFTDISQRAISKKVITDENVWLFEDSENIMYIIDALNSSSPAAAMVSEEPAPAQVEDELDAAMSDQDDDSFESQFRRAKERVLNPEAQRKQYEKFDSQGQTDAGERVSVLSQFESIRKEVSKRVIALTNANDHVLFLADGLGHLAKQVMDDSKGLNLDIEATDFNEEFTEVARKERGVNQHVENAYDMRGRYDDGVFDVVVLNEAIGVFDIEKVLTEVMRILKPGGRLILTTYPGDTPLGLRVFKTNFSKYVHYARDDIQNGLEGVGFKNVEIDFITREVEPEYPEETNIIFDVFTAEVPSEAEAAAMVGEEPDADFAMDFAQSPNRYPQVVIEKERSVRYQPSSAKIELSLTPKGKPIDIVQLYIDTFESIVGYKPIVAVHGSASYLLDQHGQPDWSIIDDVDIIAVSPETDRMELISNTFYQKLGVSEEDLAKRKMEGVGKLYDSQGRHHAIHVLYSTGGFHFNHAYATSYIPTNLFFGDTDKMHDYLRKKSAKELSDFWLKVYRFKWQQVADKGWGNRASSKRVHLKRLYHLAVLQGREEEYQSLIDTYKTASDGSEEVEEMVQRVKGELEIKDRAAFKRDILQHFTNESPPAAAMVSEEPAPAQADDTSNAAMSEAERFVEALVNDNYEKYEELIKAINDPDAIHRLVEQAFDQLGLHPPQILYLRDDLLIKDHNLYFIFLEVHSKKNLERGGTLVKSYTFHVEDNGGDEIKWDVSYAPYPKEYHKKGIGTLVSLWWATHLRIRKELAGMPMRDRGTTYNLVRMFQKASIFGIFVPSELQKSPVQMFYYDGIFPIWEKDWAMKEERAPAQVEDELDAAMSASIKEQLAEIKRQMDQSRNDWTINGKITSKEFRARMRALMAKRKELLGQSHGDPDGAMNSDFAMATYPWPENVNEIHFKLIQWMKLVGQHNLREYITATRMLTYTHGSDMSTEEAQILSLFEQVFGFQVERAGTIFNKVVRLRTRANVHLRSDVFVVSIPTWDDLLSEAGLTWPMGLMLKVKFIQWIARVHTAGYKNKLVVAHMLRDKGDTTIPGNEEPLRLFQEVFGYEEKTLFPIYDKFRYEKEVGQKQPGRAKSQNVSWPPWSEMLDLGRLVADTKLDLEQRDKIFEIFYPLFRQFLYVMDALGIDVSAESMRHYHDNTPKPMLEALSEFEMFGFLNTESGAAFMESVNQFLTGFIDAYTWDQFIEPGYKSTAVTSALELDLTFGQWFRQALRENPEVAEGIEEYGMKEMDKNKLLQYSNTGEGLEDGDYMIIRGVRPNRNKYQFNPTGGHTQENKQFTISFDRTSHLEGDLDLILVYSKKGEEPGRLMVYALEDFILDRPATPLAIYQYKKKYKRYKTPGARKIQVARDRIIAALQGKYIKVDEDTLHEATVTVGGNGQATVTFDGKEYTIPEHKVKQYTDRAIDLHEQKVIFHIEDRGERNPMVHVYLKSEYLALIDNPLQDIEPLISLVFKNRDEKLEKGEVVVVNRELLAIGDYLDGAEYSSEKGYSFKGKLYAGTRDGGKHLNIQVQFNYRQWEKMSRNLKVVSEKAKEKHKNNTDPIEVTGTMVKHDEYGWLFIVTDEDGDFVTCYKQPEPGRKAKQFDLDRARFIDGYLEAEDINEETFKPTEFQGEEYLGENGYLSMKYQGKGFPSIELPNLKGKRPYLVPVKLEEGLAYEIHDADAYSTQPSRIPEYIITRNKDNNRARIIFSREELLEAGSIESFLDEKQVQSAEWLQIYLMLVIRLLTAENKFMVDDAQRLRSLRWLEGVVLGDAFLEGVLADQLISVKQRFGTVVEREADLYQEAHRVLDRLHVSIEEIEKAARFVRGTSSLDYQDIVSLVRDVGVSADIEFQSFVDRILKSSNRQREDHERFVEILKARFLKRVENEQGQKSSEEFAKVAFGISEEEFLERKIIEHYLALPLKKFAEQYPEEAWYMLNYMQRHPRVYEADEIVELRKSIPPQHIFNRGFAIIDNIISNLKIADAWWQEYGFDKGISPARIAAENLDYLAEAYPLELARLIFHRDIYGDIANTRYGQAWLSENPFAAQLRMRFAQTNRFNFLKQELAQPVESRIGDLIQPGAVRSEEDVLPPWMRGKGGVEVVKRNLARSTRQRQFEEEVRSEDKYGQDGFKGMAIDAFENGETRLVRLIEVDEDMQAGQKYQARAIPKMPGFYMIFPDNFDPERGLHGFEMHESPEAELKLGDVQFLADWGDVWLIRIGQSDRAMNAKLPAFKAFPVDMQRMVIFEETQDPENIRKGIETEHLMTDLYDEAGEEVFYDLLARIKTSYPGFEFGYYRQLMIDLIISMLIENLASYEYADESNSHLADHLYYRLIDTDEELQLQFWGRGDKEFKGGVLTSKDVFWSNDPPWSIKEGAPLDLRHLDRTGEGEGIKTIYTSALNFPEGMLGFSWKVADPDVHGRLPSKDRTKPGHLITFHIKKEMFKPGVLSRFYVETIEGLGDFDPTVLSEFLIDFDSIYKQSEEPDEMREAVEYYNEEILTSEEITRDHIWQLFQKFVFDIEDMDFVTERMDEYMEEIIDILNNPYTSIRKDRVIKRAIKVHNLIVKDEEIDNSEYFGFRRVAWILLNYVLYQHGYTLFYFSSRSQRQRLYKNPSQFFDAVSSGVRKVRADNAMTGQNEVIVDELFRGDIFDSWVTTIFNRDRWFIRALRKNQHEKYPKFINQINDPDRIHEAVREALGQKGIIKLEVSDYEDKPNGRKIIITKKTILGDVELGTFYFWILGDYIRWHPVISKERHQRKGLGPLIYLWWATHPKLRKEFAGMRMRGQANYQQVRALERAVVFGIHPPEGARYGREYPYSGVFPIWKNDAAMSAAPDAAMGFGKRAPSRIDSPQRVREIAARWIEKESSLGSYSFDEVMFGRANAPIAIAFLVGAAERSDEIAGQAAIEVLENIIDEHADKEPLVYTAVELLNQVVFTRFNRITRKTVEALEKMIEKRNEFRTDHVPFAAAITLAHIVRLAAQDSNLINEQTVAVLRNALEEEYVDNPDNIGAFGAITLALLEINTNRPEFINFSLIDVLHAALQQFSKAENQSYAKNFSRRVIEGAIQSLRFKDSAEDDYKKFSTPPELTHFLQIIDYGYEFAGVRREASSPQEAKRIASQLARMDLKTGEHRSFLSRAHPYFQETTFDSLTQNHFLLMGGKCADCVGKQVGEILHLVSEAEEGTVAHITVPLKATFEINSRLVDSLKYLLPRVFRVNDWFYLEGMPFPTDYEWMNKLVENTQVLVFLNGKLQGRFLSGATDDAKRRTLALHFQTQTDLSKIIPTDEIGTISSAAMSSGGGMEIDEELTALDQEHEELVEQVQKAEEEFKEKEKRYKDLKRRPDLIKERTRSYEDNDFVGDLDELIGIKNSLRVQWLTGGYHNLDNIERLSASPKAFIQTANGIMQLLVAAYEEIDEYFEMLFGKKDGDDAAMRGEIGLAHLLKLGLGKIRTAVGPPFFEWGEILMGDKLFDTELVSKAEEGIDIKFDFDVIEVSGRETIDTHKLFEEAGFWSAINIPQVNLFTKIEDEAAFNFVMDQIAKVIIQVVHEQKRYRVDNTVEGRVIATQKLTLQKIEDLGSVNVPNLLIKVIATRGKKKFIVEEDHAMIIDLQEGDNAQVGGIDLDASEMDLQIEGASGVDCLEEPNHKECIQFQFTPEQIQEMRSNMTGITPIIINIQPIPNLPLFLGVNDSEEEKDQQLAQGFDLVAVRE